MPKPRRRESLRRFSLELLEDRRLPAVLTVNTTADDTTADSTLSLREAIELVDGTLAISALSPQEQAQVSGSLSSTPDTIDFNIPGSGVQTITPTSALPVITVPVTIDGYSQPGASANTLATGDNAVLLIQLSGNNAGTNADGLTIDGGNSVVRGLVINSFGAGATSDRTRSVAIRIDQNGGDVIKGNFLGIDPAGTTALSNPRDGIDVVGSSYNTIGGTAPADRNVIAGFGVSDIDILQSNSGVYAASELIQGNYIGTDRTGTKTLTASNLGTSPTGIELNHALLCLIGGTAGGAGNLISGGYLVGIMISGSYEPPPVGESPGGNVVEGNKIGTDATGMNIIGDMIGILITDSMDNMIGGTTAGAANLISGSLGNGVFIGASSADPLGNHVIGNLIGTDITGKPDLGNGAGVFVGASGNTIGGFEKSEGNVIADSLPTPSAGIPFNYGVRVGPSFFATPRPPFYTGNLVLSNAIYGNLGLGIDETPIASSWVGVSSAATTVQTTVVAGILVGQPNTSYTLQFFTSPTSGASSGAQAESLLASATVSTDATGQADYHVTLDHAAPSGSWITATATGGTGNTSPLAAPLQVGSVRQVVPADFTGTGKSEPAVFEPKSAEWYALGASGGQSVGSFGAGGGTDVLAPGDYDATGKTELAVFRPSTGQWYVLGPTGGRLVATFGGPGDVPVPGDYDGVGYTEPAVFRPSTGQWYVLGPNGGYLLATFGATGNTDIPVPGDYDGVGHTEPAVYRPSTGEWYVLGPSGGKSLGTFGGPNSGDLPVPGDYDGVGHAELAVFRPSTAQWFVLGPNGGTLFATFGAKDLAQVPAVGSAGFQSAAAKPTVTVTFMNVTRSLAPVASDLSSQPDVEAAPLLIPLVPSSDAASPLQASDRKHST